MGNDQDAEDAVQESVLKALRAFSGQTGPEIKPWFLAIVRNTCLNLLRSRNRRSARELSDEEMLMNLPEGAPGPAAALEITYNAEQLKSALETLPAGYRELIILREFEQMSYKELAEVAAIPIGTVMSRLARARERLHQLLSKECAV
jgi:RNA polymerase sigma-70 factor (ECF subfamily)